MAHGNSHTSHEIKNPGTFETPAAIKTAFLIFAVIGIIAFAAGLATDPTRAWATFVHNHFYFLSIALGGIFFAAIQWLTSAMWSAPIRRVMESFTAYLPVAIVMAAVLYFGMHYLYPWTHAEHVDQDVLLAGKKGYLNVGFFMVRGLVGLGILFVLAKKMVGNSIAQDRDSNIRWTEKNRVLAPIFLMLFALLYSMLSFDELMSLDPHWFSTMFGVYCFAGLFYATLATITILTIYLKKVGKLQGIVNDNHIHDMGKFMFAFTVFWAYIGFSQFMLIWYANIPEETGYFMLRMQGAWFYVSCFLVFGKFMVPFFLLMPRDAKRNERLLVGVGFFMLIAQWIDFLWIVQPSFYQQGPHIGWMEIGTALGFLGIFGFTVSQFLARNNVVAIGDPRLAESVFHHHQ